MYFRPMPGQDPELLINRARDSANECGVELRIRYRGEPMYTDPDSHFVQESLALAGRSAPRTVCYGTDGGTFTELKQKIVFGPGDIAQAHTEDEWVSLEQLESGTNAFERLIREWCC